MAYIEGNEINDAIFVKAIKPLLINDLDGFDSFESENITFQKVLDAYARGQDVILRFPESVYDNEGYACDLNLKLTSLCDFDTQGEGRLRFTGVFEHDGVCDVYSALCTYDDTTLEDCISGSLEALEYIYYAITDTGTNLSKSKTYASDVNELVQNKNAAILVRIRSGTAGHYTWKDCLATNVKADQNSVTFECEFNNNKYLLDHTAALVSCDVLPQIPTTYETWTSFTKNDFVPNGKFYSLGAGLHKVILKNSATLTDDVILPYFSGIYGQQTVTFEAGCTLMVYVDTDLHYCFVQADRASYDTQYIQDVNINAKPFLYLYAYDDHYQGPPASLSDATPTEVPIGVNLYLFADDYFAHFTERIHGALFTLSERSFKFFNIAGPYTDGLYYNPYGFKFFNRITGETINQFKTPFYIRNGIMYTFTGETYKDLAHNSSTNSLIASINAPAYANYKLQEHVVGTWLDGETLYERTFKTLANATNITIVSNLPRIKVVGIEAILVDEDTTENPTQYYSVNAFGATGRFNKVTIEHDTIDNAITATVYSTLQSNITWLYTTIRYIKQV